MHDSKTSGFADCTFRSNPVYELVEFGRLGTDEKLALSEFIRDPNYYGILRPRGNSSFTIKAVCRDVALLYLSLMEPGRLPAYVKTMFGERCIDEIARLVMDGLLELDCDGQFVTGRKAFKLIVSDETDYLPTTRIARLSFDALRYAIALDHDDALTLATRLYCFNRVPASHQWQCRLSSEFAVADYLGINEGSANHRLLDRYWLPTDPKTNPWLAWKSRKFSTRDTRLTGTCKLYISPILEDLPEVLPIVLRALTEFEASNFKVGRDIFSLLRPDKFIAYFPQGYEQALACACSIKHRLAGFRPQGTPFTADIPETDILSWGIDPPIDLPSIHGQGSGSWRTFVVNQLASALLTDKSADGSPDDLLHFALKRVALEGINVATWTPAVNFWEML